MHVKWTVTNKGGEVSKSGNFEETLFEWPSRWWLHTLIKISSLFNYLRIEYVFLIATVTHNYSDSHGVMMYMLLSVFFKGCVRYIFASFSLGQNENICQNKKNVFCFTSKLLFFL